MMCQILYVCSSNTRALVAEWANDASATVHNVKNVGQQPIERETVIEASYWIYRLEIIDQSVEGRWGMIAEGRSRAQSFQVCLKPHSSWLWFTPRLPNAISVQAYRIMLIGERPAFTFQFCLTDGRGRPEYGARSTHPMRLI